jgi:dipeptidase D
MKGGMSGNAIPRSGKMEVAIPADAVEQAKAVCAAFLKELQTEGKETEAQITLEVLGEEKTQVLSLAETARVLDFVLGLPNGLQTWDAKFEGLPQTSLNMGILEISDHLEILYHLRSSVNEEKRALMDGLKETVEKAGGSYSETGVYSAWEYHDHSAFRDVMINVYQQTSDKPVSIQMIHAGLECGAFSEKIPGLDCVSNGPNAGGCHTAKEYLDIAGTARYWEYMKKVLKAL